MEKHNRLWDSYHTSAGKLPTPASHFCFCSSKRSNFHPQLLPLLLLHTKNHALLYVICPSTSTKFVPPLLQRLLLCRRHPPRRLAYVISGGSKGNGIRTPDDPRAMASGGPKGDGMPLNILESESADLDHEAAPHESRLPRGQDHCVKLLPPSKVVLRIFACVHTDRPSSLVNS
ncbi:hypothetical protein KP509_01G059400 [Ceratopteris richardii]|uniref:Uncharacterized protein n=1 Tax=Ceratopteris richardii TaxID=49495 RepID=A0A8T2VDG3_CERRI|nr:hypothetical protein KP509_01G059400 [Ceratopteris richardii]